MHFLSQFFCDMPLSLQMRFISAINSFTDGTGTDVIDTISFEWKVISVFTGNQTVTNEKIFIHIASIS